MVGLVEGSTATVTPKGFTLLSLTTAGPKRQAPPCATVSPCGTSSLRDPDGFVAIPPILCRGPQVFVWVLGGRCPPECAHPSSPSQHMLDATTDDNLSTANIAMVTINGCCWKDLCGGAEPAPAPQAADPHPRDCRYPLPSTSPISSTLYPTIPRSQLPNPSPSPHVCLQLHQLCLSFPSPVFATPGRVESLPWDIFLSPNFGQGCRVGGMLSEGSVAVATRGGCLQATAQGCCRDALEAEREGPGRWGMYP